VVTPAVGGCAVVSTPAVCVRAGADGDGHAGECQVLRRPERASERQPPRFPCAATGHGGPGPTLVSRAKSGGVPLGGARVP